MDSIEFDDHEVVIGDNGFVIKCHVTKKKVLSTKVPNWCPLCGQFLDKGGKDGATKQKKEGKDE